MIVDRRQFLGAGGTALVAGAIGGFNLIAPADAAADRFEYVLSDAAWRKKLSPDAYAVLRRAATEQPGSSALLKEHRAGTFLCAGCDLPLFSSRTKYDSGTGWPSFWQPLPRAIATSRDSLLGYTRTEVHCRRCGGHLGHIFDDGPKPTGLRSCMNGLALKFTPART